MSIFDFLKKQEGEKSSTQAYLDIADIKDSLVILKSGGLRLVIEVSATNFDLKSEEEQEIIIGQYQSFLNSLEFPIQILIQSRKIDLSSYINDLKKRMESEQNELLRIQMNDYIIFLEDLITQANIMDKKFYVVVPFDPPLLNSSQLQSLAKIGKTEDKTTGVFSESEFQAHKDGLLKRAQALTSGLSYLGLRSRQLNNQELAELFYSIYNPEIAAEEHLKQVEELVAPVIEEKKTNDTT